MPRGRLNEYMAALKAKSAQTLLNVSPWYDDKR